MKQKKCSIFVKELIKRKWKDFFLQMVYSVFLGLRQFRYMHKKRFKAGHVTTSVAFISG